MTGISQHERDHFFGDGVGVGTGRVHDIDFSLPGVFGVDGVVTGSGSDDDFELGQGVNQLLINFFAPDNERIGVGMLRGEGVEFGLGVLYHGVISVGFKEFFGNRVEFGRDQYFFHSFLRRNGEWPPK